MTPTRATGRLGEGIKLMSANIYWIPISNATRSLNVSTPGRFIEAMDRAFGGQPWRLDHGALSRLEGMSAMWDHDPNPFEQLIAAIQHDDGTTNEIQVWPEY